MPPVAFLVKRRYNDGMINNRRTDRRVPASAALLLLLLGTWPIRAQEDPAPGRVDWGLIETIVSRIESPQIPARVYRVADFGAAGDGVADARPAILAAIARASDEGGGRVVLSPGVWRSNGPIHLQSRIELHLERGAHLLFSPDPQLYLPVVETRWEGTRVLSYSPLIYARGVEDVAITGPGTIDGNAQSGFHGWHRQAEPDMLRLRRMGFTGVPLDERVFAAGTHLRPPLVQFVRARRVRLEGYTAVNSPFWVNHLVYCEHATVRGLNVESHFPNNDGVDVDSSSWVLVEGSTFRTGDDSVVVKSGRDLDGRTVAKPSEYVVVRDNDMGGEDGIALGSEMSGDIRYVFFTDNVLRSGASAIRFKANLDRGGTVEHVGVRRFTVGSFERLIWFQLDYPSQLGGNFPSTYRDIVFEDFEVGDVGTLFEAHAPAAAPLRDVVVRDVSAASAGQTVVLENVQGLRFENVTVAGRPVSPPAADPAEQGNSEQPPALEPSADPNQVTPRDQSGPSDVTPVRTVNRQMTPRRGAPTEELAPPVPPTHCELRITNSGLSRSQALISKDLGRRSIRNSQFVIRNRQQKQDTRRAPFVVGRERLTHGRTLHG